MRQAIEHYQLELTVKGPVFVGSGLEIQKKEYLFLNRQNIGVIDMAKLYQMAKRRHLEGDLERFLVRDVKEDLKQWSVRNRISEKEMGSCMKYITNVGDLQMEKGRMQIMACTADPYGNPYIPGSSVKGMLRTILLCADILKNKGKYAEDARQIRAELRKQGIKRNQVLRRNTAVMEEKAFHTLNRKDPKRDAVNDVLSGIAVSDSAPLSREDMILCQKWEQHTNGSYKSINILRECVKPGTVIKSELTIDTTICKISVEDILESVRLFYEHYYQVFQKKFPKMDRCAPNTVFLGGGSGYVSKTATYALFGGEDGVRVVQDIFDRTNVPGNHKHYRDLRLGVSPHILKCTRYQGKEYMMGQCEVRIS